jgi:hypothetical protein
MIETKTYTTKEICEALNIKETSFKSHKEKFLKDYDYVETKVGRSKYKFIKLCEQIAKEDVKFPKESTAENILLVLMKKDCTILDYEEIGLEIPGYLERHTIGRYIELFRKYKILPPVLSKVPKLSFNKETVLYVALSMKNY